MLIFSCPHTLNRDALGNELPARSAKRENLSVQLSYDDGQSWPRRKTLEAGKSAYSDLAVLPDSSILCLYEGDMKIVCARFNLEWILD
jgi:sialidase-1